MKNNNTHAMDFQSTTDITAYIRISAVLSIPQRMSMTERITQSVSVLAFGENCAALLTV